jgi:hypothetical protein
MENKDENINVDKNSEKGANSESMVLYRTPNSRVNVCTTESAAHSPQRQMQTGSSETLTGWKFGETTYVPLWDRMEGA